MSTRLAVILMFAWTIIVGGGNLAGSSFVEANLTRQQQKDGGASAGHGRGGGHGRRLRGRLAALGRRAGPRAAGAFEAAPSADVRYEIPRSVAAVLLERLASPAVTGVFDGDARPDAVAVK
jgi:hypothetical protein